MKNKILDNKGITGIDLSISLIVLTIFSGLIISLMSSIYKNSLEIQKGSNAMAYATMILEKVDEKSFNQVDENFIATLENEIKIDDGYTVEIISADDIEEGLLKKVVLKVSYDINGEEKIDINKQIKNKGNI